MKLARYFSLISLVSLMFFSACTPKEEEDYLGLDTGPNTFVANLEGESWSAAKKEAVLNDDYLTVYGETSVGKLMAIRVKLYKYQPVDMTYVLNNSSDHYITYDPSSRLDSLIFWSKNNPESFGQSGDIVITKLDEQYNLVSGEFKTRVYNNHDANDFFYFSQGSFTDVPIVDSLTINVSGEEIVNIGDIIGDNTGDDTGDDDTGGDTGGDTGDDTGDDTGGNTEDDTEFVNCTIDLGILGVSSFNSSTETVSINGSILQIESSSGFSSVTIELLSSLGVGEYDLYENNDISIFYYEGTQPYFLNAIGTLIITEKTSEIISGTFNVTLTHMLDSGSNRTLSNGSFSVSLLQ